MLQINIRSNAYHYVCSHRTHKHGAMDRLKFYGGLFPKSAKLPTGQSVKAGFLEMIHPIEPQLLRAMFLHRDGHFEEALGIYMKLLELTPEFHVIWMRLRDLYQATGGKEQVELCHAEINRLTARHY